MKTDNRLKIWVEYRRNDYVVISSIVDDKIDIQFVNEIKSSLRIKSLRVVCMLIVSKEDQNIDDTLCKYCVKRQGEKGYVTTAWVCHLITSLSARETSR